MIVVEWDGAVPSGQVPNPVKATMSPLVAAMLSTLIRDPAFMATARRHPLAYRGIIELGMQIDRTLFTDATNNPVHYDVAPGQDAAGYMRQVRAGLDTIPAAREVNSERVEEKPVQYAPGRARIGWAVD
jgi:hypothetical protein